MGISRRDFLSSSLARGAVVGCSAAASPLMTPITLAQAPTDNRLVVIVLRGAMDGLAVVQPYGDADLAALRPGQVHGPAGGAQDLDGFFALHEGLADLMPLWRAGDLAFATAVATPYRDRRSHFDGQDLLETGLGMEALEGRLDEGWLNRLLQVLPGARRETALAIGRGRALILRGAAPAQEWSPEARLLMTPATEALLAHVYHDDPLFADSLEEALGLSAVLMEDGGSMVEEMTSDEMVQAMSQAIRRAPSAGRVDSVAQFAAEQLAGDTRIAAFSIGGWDTHRNQPNGLRRPLAALSEAIETLRADLGPAWERTTVLAMTEFGRTARMNGTNGTDHGTAGAMVLAGGAVAGGRVFGDWPGLAEADLYARRDLMPTGDVRAYAAHAIAGLFGIERATLQTAIFPGLDLGRDPGLLL